MFEKIKNFISNLISKKKKNKVKNKKKDEKTNQKIVKKIIDIKKSDTIEKTKNNDNVLTRIFKNNLPKEIYKIIEKKYNEIEKDIIKFRLDLETYGIGYFVLPDKNDLYIVLFVDKNIYVGKRENNVFVPKYGGYVSLNKNEIRIYPLLSAIIASKTRNIEKMKRYISFKIIYENKIKK
jgi:hypothetical protein